MTETVLNCSQDSQSSRTLSTDEDSQSFHHSRLCRSDVCASSFSKLAVASEEEEHREEEEEEEEEEEQGEKSKMKIEGDRIRRPR